MLSEKADAVEPQPQIKHSDQSGSEPQTGWFMKSHTFTGPNPLELSRVFVSSSLTKSTNLGMGCFY